MDSKSSSQDSSSRQGLDHSQAETLLDKVAVELHRSSFLRAFYEKAIKNNPQNIGCLRELSDLYQLQGKYEQRLAIDLRMIRLRPKDADSYFRLACSHSQLNEIDQSLTALRHAFELGFMDRNELNHNEALENLRDSIGMTELVVEFLGNSQS